MTTLEVRDKRLKTIVVDQPVVKRAAGFEFTEGAVWSPSGTIIFSDIPADKLYEFDPRTQQVTTYRDPSNKANGNTYDHQQRLITCEHSASRVVREEGDRSLTVLAAQYAGAELNSPNDVIVDRAGRVLFTDPPQRANGRHGRRSAAVLTTGPRRVPGRSAGLLDRDPR